MIKSQQTTCFDRGNVSLLCCCYDGSSSSSSSSSSVVATSDRADARIFTLCIDRGQNVFNPTMIALLSEALDIVEQATHPKALVVTGRGKFFSNGLDLQFLEQHDQIECNVMIESLWRFLARLLVMDCRTVAAINGHGFGAGLFLALACDFRIMRTQRGYLCWPELNLGMRLAKGFAELSKAKITSAATLRQGVLTGKRYGSQDALRDGIVDDTCPVEQLEARAMDLARQGLAENLHLANFNPGSFSQMKIELYTDAYRALHLGKAVDLPHSRL